MKIKRQKCEAYFKGQDGLGTCDTECQWYRPKLLCLNSVEAFVILEKAIEHNRKKRENLLKK